MDTLGQRIKKVIIHNGNTMTSFAKEINISQSMVSKICSDKAIPSERTLLDICRVFNVNKDWLFYGIGDMVDKQSLKKEISESFTGETSDAAKTILLSLVDIPPAVWPILAEELHKLADSCKNENTDQSAYEKGRQAGKHAWDVIQEAIRALPDDPEE